MFSQGQYERRFDALDSQTLIRQIHAVADGLLAGEAVPSGHYSAIFDTNALASLFGCFQAALSGKWAQQDQPLARQAGPVGGLPLAHPGEPGLICRAACTSRPSMARVPPPDLLLIGEGELKTLLHNSATAHHFGLASNGSAARNARSALDVSPRHLVFGLGPHSEAEAQGGEYLSWSSWTACTPAPMR